MPSVVFRSADGQETTVHAEPGLSVMEAAIQNGIGGIVAECGGAMICATCHVYVDDPGDQELPPVSDEESEMLDLAAAPRRPSSRLSCQLRLAEEATCLSVEVPERQL